MDKGYNERKTNTRQWKTDQQIAKDLAKLPTFESVYVEWQGRKGVVPDEILVRKLKQLHDQDIIRLKDIIREYQENDE